MSLHSNGHSYVLSERDWFKRYVQNCGGDYQCPPLSVLRLVTQRSGVWRGTTSSLVVARIVQAGEVSLVMPVLNTM